MTDDHKYRIRGPLRARGARYRVTRGRRLLAYTVTRRGAHTLVSRHRQFLTQHAAFLADGELLAANLEARACRYCRMSLYGPDAHGAYSDRTGGDCCTGDPVTGANENGVHTPKGRP